MEQIIVKNKMLHKKNGMKNQMVLQSMVWPGLIALMVFSYLPMLGLIMVFQEYDIFAGFFSSRWVGMGQFKAFFTNPQFPIIIRNTLIISSAKILFGFPAPIILAILFNEIHCTGIKKVFQTITYLPYFLSWVVIGGMISILLSVDGGSVNDILVASKIVGEPLNFMSEPRYFRTILVVSNMWRTVGYDAIIYIAAISGINLELYEAAQIDGAGKLRQIVSITIPEIMPQIVMMLILRIGQLLNAGYEDILVLTNNGDNSILLQVGDVIDTYVYRYGIKMHRYSYSAAVGLFKSIVSVIMLIIANTISKKYTENSLW